MGLFSRKKKNASDYYSNARTNIEVPLINYKKDDLHVHFVEASIEQRVAYVNKIKQSDSKTYFVNPSVDFVPKSTPMLLQIARLTRMKQDDVTALATRLEIKHLLKYNRKQLTSAQDKAAEIMTALLLGYENIVIDVCAKQPDETPYTNYVALFVLSFYMFKQAANLKFTIFVDSQSQAKDIIGKYRSHYWDLTNGNLVEVEDFSPPEYSFYVEINRSRCDCCRKCFDICEQKAITTHVTPADRYVGKVLDSRCNQCHKCIEQFQCPQDAIRIVKRKNV